MANQIPGLQPSKPGPPGTVYHWKPSPRLRRLGWQNLKLGTDWNAAIGKAQARNDEVKAQLQGTDGTAGDQALLRPRWRDLIVQFRKSAAYTGLKRNSRAEYDSRIRTLTAWAQDGDLILGQLDRQMVMDLRNVLVDDGRPHRTAALLRVLSLLMTFAEDRGWVAVGVARKLKIPAPPKRTRRVLRDHVPHLLAAADDLGGMAHVRLGVVLGFYSMQREADLLAATGFQIRPVDDVSSDARRTLAGDDGKVNGLWLQQAKTDEWVAVSLAPAAREAVEAAILAGREKKRTCTNLILYPGEDRACPDWRFQRDFRAVVNRAVEMATQRQDHALARLLAGNPDKARDAIQFRDLRRSGMCWLRELGVPVPLIASISGHSIEETQKILDTYMPRDTRAAAEGMAIAVARQTERDAADAAEREAQG